MEQPGYQVRRATLEDLEALRQLWKQSLLPVAELERRFTEFKVAVSDIGELYGAIGLQTIGNQGWLHSEAFNYPELDELLRPQFWDRLQVVAHNRRLTRLWTQEQAPFWQRYAGFKPAATADLAQFPVSFGDPNGRWLTMPLREEVQADAIGSVEEQLEQLRGSQQEQTERIMRHARRLRTFATVIAMLLFIAVLMAGVYLIRRHPLAIGR